MNKVLDVVVFISRASVLLTVIAILIDGFLI
jgi:hypothetical protein